jgi:putative FmdB family regulatory protein
MKAGIFFPAIAFYLFFVMPIYEFHCEKCERNSEILVRTADWKDSECPHCGSKKLSKKNSMFAAAGAGETSTGKKSSGGHGCGGACSCH